MFLMGLTFYAPPHLSFTSTNCSQTINSVQSLNGMFDPCDRNCDDYDLCEECEPLEGIHDPDHVFIKLRRPTLTAGRRKNGEVVPLLKRSLYATPEVERSVLILIRSHCATSL